MIPRYDLVAIGGGTGGLVAAAGAAYLGLRSAIVERTALGGDCLWTGCVPSKALIASARRAHGMRHGDDLGLTPFTGGHPFADVMERMRRARSTVAHHDDPQRFRDMGVDVHFGAARFVDRETLDVEGVGTVRAKRFVIATGAVPSIPPVPGLAEVAYWTHETVFDQTRLPASITILGGGPIGLEFAQIFSRLGSRTTLVEMAPRILPKEDADVASFMEDRLRDEGIVVYTGTEAREIRLVDGTTIVKTDGAGEIRGERLFVATGRRPNTDGLNLEAVGVRTERGAVVVDAHLRTSVASIWAVGDVTGGLQFTHVAEHMAKTALQNAILPIRRKVRYDTVPWVTYTDPEIAHVGLGEADADAVGGTTYRYDLADLDRAIVDGTATGFVKVSADRRGKVLGATIVGHRAGDLIQSFVLAKQHGLGLGKVAGTVFPYPTMVEGVKRASNEYMRSRLDSWSGRMLKRVIQWLK